MKSNIRAVEQFHLAFCQVAASMLTLGDFALKGGVNLRFFLGSPRLSADLDFDYLGPGFEALAKRVDRLLLSRALQELLRFHGLSLTFDNRRSKDTALVKRWKMRLGSEAMIEVATKIEFSNRRSSARPDFAQIDSALARRLGGVAVRLSHYGPIAAVEQKISALAGRSETEPRDVFDLDHLFRRYPAALQGAQAEREAVRTAIERAMEIPYGQYKDLVVEYLEDEFVDLYGTEQAWSDMALRVVEELGQKLGDLS